MKKRLTEEQIIGFLREAGAGMPVAELCRFLGSQLLSLAQQVWWHECLEDQAPQSTRDRERSAEEDVRRRAA